MGRESELGTSPVGTTLALTHTYGRVAAVKGVFSIESAVAIARCNAVDLACPGWPARFNVSEFRGSFSSIASGDKVAGGLPSEIGWRSHHRHTAQRQDVTAPDGWSG